MTRCLVIGGGGFVGSSFAACARDRRMHVTVVGRGDYAAEVGAAFDVVVFAAGNARRYLADRDPAADLDANVGAVYRAIRDFSCASFVLLSSVDVYGAGGESREATPIDAATLAPYARHKRFAEIIAARHAPRPLILRLGQMLGPGLSKGPVFDLLQGEPLRVSLASTYPFLRTSTAAEIAFALVEEGVRDAVFNVCARGSVALERVAALLSPGRAPAARPEAIAEHYAIDVSALSARRAVPTAWDEVRAFAESRG